MVVPPFIVFFIGALLLLFLRGRARDILLIAVPTIAAVDLALARPGASWIFKFMGFDVVLLQVDKLSLFMGYIFVLIGWLGLLYSLKVRENWHDVNALIYIGSSMGFVFAGDFFAFVFFWEIMAITGTFLIMSGKSEKAIRAGFRYFAFHLLGDVALLAGLLMHFHATGSISVGLVQSGLPAFLVATAVGVNAAFVLLHTWLPDAYPSAPFTASVFLCVYTTKAAVYAMGRVSPGVDWIALMGGAMALYGVTFAVMQNNARRLLSYHVISQVGYMIAGVGMGTALSLNGGFFHVFNHILYKAGLFMGVGAVLYMTGKEELSELGGLARKMPITTISTTVVAFSISGVPLFNGFVSKGLVVQASEPNFPLFVMLELASVGTFLSFLKLLYFGFYRSNSAIEARDPPLNMKVAMGATAFLCFFIGVYPDSVVRILPYPTQEYHFYSAPHVLGVSQLLGMTALLFFLARTVYSPHRITIRDFDYIYRGAANAFLRFVEKPWTRLHYNVHWDYDLGVKAVGRTFRAAFAFDSRVVDGAVDGVGKSGFVTSIYSRAFDLVVVDGAVNGVGDSLKAGARRLRTTATGIIEDYASAIAAGVLLLIFILR